MRGQYAPFTALLSGAHGRPFFGCGNTSGTGTLERQGSRGSTYQGHGTAGQKTHHVPIKEDVR
jgi:hypothetical protein